jgi:hypothetical protein
MNPLFCLLTLLTPHAYALPPADLTVTAKYLGSSTPTTMKDSNGETVTFFGANFDSAVFTPPINDSLNTSNMGGFVFLSPPQGGCQLTDFNLPAVGAGSQLLMMAGRDAAGVKDCQEFLQAVATQGFVLRVLDAPLLNNPRQIYHNVDFKVSP